MKILYRKYFYYFINIRKLKKKHDLLQFCYIDNR